MSQPIQQPHLHLNHGLQPGFVAPAPGAGYPQPVPGPSVAPRSFTHMPDGSWADAQFELSSQADPMQELQQKMLQKSLQQRQMFLTQQRAALTNKMTMDSIKNNAPSAEIKLVSSPDLPSMFADDGAESAAAEE